MTQLLAFFKLFELWVLFLINPARVANFRCHRDLLIIQEMLNELIQTAPEAANKICRPLMNRLAARQRFSGVQTFDGLRDWRSWDYPWIARPAAGVMTASLRSGLTSFRSSATKGSLECQEYSYSQW
jgi:hypothetical protein